MTSVLLQPGEHTHSGDPVENSLLAVRDHMKAKAVEGRESNHQILLGAAAASSDAVASQMPSVSTMRRTLRKQRRRAIHPYTIPTTKRNLEIPVEFKVTLRGEDFLLHDTGFGDSERILVFSTAENLRKLGESELWFADGTFKVSPSLFYQVYTIHGSLHGTVVPLVFALLSNKTQSTYARLFSVLRAHINHLNVKVIYTDFELAAMNSFQNQFPGVLLQACFFHLAQSVYRKVQENHDLRQRYDTDKDFSVLMRMLPALAFIPLGDLDAAFDSLMEIFPDEAMPLAQYFEDTYLGRRRGLRRISPMFAPSLWNVNDAVHQHLPRTNNSAEAWHRGFQVSFSNVKVPGSFGSRKLGRRDDGDPTSGCRRSSFVKSSRRRASRRRPS
ncbi:uncharacterized protein ISCGN_010868 [Ixodes scapularis]